jgi:hypothetical protein
MPLPRFAGYGYDTAARYQQRISGFQSGMVLPTLQPPHMTATGGVPHSIRTGGSSGPVQSAGSAGPGRLPTLWGSPAGRQRSVGPLNALQWGHGPGGAARAAHRGGHTGMATEAQELLLGIGISRLQKFRGQFPGEETAGGAVREDEHGEGADRPLPAAQGPTGPHPLLPPTPAETPDRPVVGSPMPSTRGPRSRKSAFDPNQGLLF